MFFRKKYLLAKIEASYGVDSLPTNTNGIITSDMTISPYEGNRVSRNIDRAYLGNFAEINTGPMVTIEFSVEVAGSGTAGTAPGYDALLRACGFAATVTPATDVQYDLISEAFESVTLHFWLDGQRHRATGAVGSVSVGFNREELPYFRFRFEGLYLSPTSEASVDPTYAAFTAGILPVNDTNTALTVFGFAAKTEQVSLDLANNIASRFLINSSELLITDRAPTATLLVEAPTLAAHDFFADLESHAGVTTGVLQVVHGTVAGNIVQIDCPALQLSQISVQDSDALVAYQMQAKLLPSAGDDEFKITVK